MKDGYSHEEMDEALTGRVRSFRMPVNRMTEDAMNAVRRLKEGPLQTVSRGESQWWAIVFEEAMLAVDDHLREHGSIEWQPRFIVDTRPALTRGGHPRPPISRRQERVAEFAAASKMLAELDQKGGTHHA